MAFDNKISNSFDLRAKKLLDKRSLKSDNTPYSSIEEANLTIGVYKSVGLDVWINTGTGLERYYYDESLSLVRYVGVQDLQGVLETGSVGIVDEIKIGKKVIVDSEEENKSGLFIEQMKGTKEFHIPSEISEIDNNSYEISYYDEYIYILSQSGNIRKISNDGLDNQIITSNVFGYSRMMINNNQIYLIKLSETEGNFIELRDLSNPSSTGVTSVLPSDFAYLYEPKQISYVFYNNALYLYNGYDRLIKFESDFSNYDIINIEDRYRINVFNCNQRLIKVYEDKIYLLSYFYDEDNPSMPLDDLLELNPIDNSISSVYRNFVSNVTLTGNLIIDSFGNFYLTYQGSSGVVCKINNDFNGHEIINITNGSGGPIYLIEERNNFIIGVIADGSVAIFDLNQGVQSNRSESGLITGNYDITSNENGVFIISSLKSSLFKSSDEYQTKLLGIKGGEIVETFVKPYIPTLQEVFDQAQPNANWSSGQLYWENTDGGSFSITNGVRIGSFYGGLEAFMDVGQIIGAYSIATIKADQITIGDNRYPTSFGSNGQVLTTNGSGTLNWQSLPSQIWSWDSVNGIMKVNGSSGVSNTGQASFLVGNDAGATNTGYGLTAIGYQAGQTNNQNFVTAIGTYAGQNNRGSQTFFAGYYAGQNNQAGDTIAIGTYAAQTTPTDATGIIALGFEAGRTITAHATINNHDVILIGDGAGKVATGVWNSIAIGRAALGNITVKSDQTIAIGLGAGQTANGTYNTLIGSYAEGATLYGAGRSIVGNHNIVLGGRSGYGTGNSNFIGGYYMANTFNGSNNVNIFGSRLMSASNTVLINTGFVATFTPVTGDIAIGNTGLITGNSVSKRVGIGLGATGNVLTTIRERLDIGNDGFMIGQGVKFFNSTFINTLDSTTLTANRTIKLQDGDGTLAFLSDLSDVVRITGLQTITSTKTFSQSGGDLKLIGNATIGLTYKPTSGSNITQSIQPNGFYTGNNGIIPFPSISSAYFGASNGNAFKLGMTGNYQVTGGNSTFAVLLPAVTDPAVNYEAVFQPKSGTVAYIQDTGKRVVWELDGFTIPAATAYPTPNSFAPIDLMSICPVIEEGYVDWEITWNQTYVKYKISSIGDLNIQLLEPAPGGCVSISGQTRLQTAIVINKVRHKPKLILTY